MKKLISIFILVSLMSFSYVASAQVVKKTGHAIKKGAKKVGQETKEHTAKAKARITDEVHKDKVGPEGQTIYIDNHAKYYWVDENGKRHYVTEAELKDKKKN